MDGSAGGWERAPHFKQKRDMVMKEMLILEEKAMQRAVARIAYEIIEHNKGAENLCLIGILSRGEELARQIAGRIAGVEGHPVETGSLDITSFRDDRRTDGHADRSQIDFPIEGKRVVLVDDVIYTGRSVRAAIDALMRRGRPLMIELAVLVDRGHRELPIRADFVGKNLPTSRDETVRVSVMPWDSENKVVIIKQER